MKLKDNTVHFKSSSIAMAAAFVIANDIFKKHNIEFVITSANDGTHSEKSKHYSDEAIDIRSKHIPDSKTKEMVLSELKLALPNFDVILEHLNEANEHFHCEWDDKKAFA